MALCRGQPFKLCDLVGVLCQCRDMWDESERYTAYYSCVVLMYEPLTGAMKRARRRRKGLVEHHLESREPERIHVTCPNDDADVNVADQPLPELYDNDVGPILYIAHLEPQPLDRPIESSKETAASPHAVTPSAVPNCQEAASIPSTRRKHPANTVSDSQEASDGQSVSVGPRRRADQHDRKLEDEIELPQPPPPQYPLSEGSASSTLPSPRPPAFSSLYTSTAEAVEAYKAAVTEADSFASPAYAPFTSEDTACAGSSGDVVAETKAALPEDYKADPVKKDQESEPPPAYSEGSSPLESFTYLMAATGGAASSIITQVQQGGPPINTLGDVGADENITMDLRGTKFTLSRDELLTLPEFVLLSLFPNGLLPDGHLNSFHEGDAFQVDVGAASSLRNLIGNLSYHIANLTAQYDPASLQYMLEFFRNVAQTIPDSSAESAEAVPVEPMAGSAKEMLQDRAGIIVLREDLDFYAIPPRSDVEQPEMIDVKRAAGKALLKQDGIFSGLKRSEETGTTEQHLIEMLTAGGFDHDDRWGHRAGEPNKAVICSLALARLRTDARGNEMGSNAVGMAQKLLLFWRKPARRCWWEGVELSDVEGVEGTLKVWIRRVWTLEMSVIGLR
ncbi:MAG: hypothetical protein M1818_008210 [Claussenomyces sp. TS43310]|nr:MAG: hypothetical protein M1818_008210 [Claussenomyces sp. TS43310]